MYFDFHTHRTNVGKHGIYNFRVGKDQKLPEGVVYFSAGIHPWDVEEVSLEEYLPELKQLLQQENCIGLGEIGLDKHFGTNLELQIEVFKSQLELLKMIPKKVLIIHCVKAYQEISYEKSQFDGDAIWVLHAFNGSSQLMHSLLKKGFYFSIGELLLKPSSKISRILNQIPTNRLLLESDDGKQPIEAVYSKAAECLQVNIDELQELVFRNVARFMPALNE